jgi:ABC-2 type transport system permease protein
LKIFLKIKLSEEYTLKEIYLRELSGYFNTPIAYVFGTAALLFNFLFFFLGIFNIIPAFWEAGQPSVRSYMYLLPVTYIFLVPAVSMRLWSEEIKQGTFELLMTLPVSDIDLVAGKFLAAWTIVSGIVFASIPLAVSVAFLGEMDYGHTAGLYLGSILMGGAYVSMGMTISALTREQIVAFILIFFASLFMFLSDYFIISQHLDPVSARIIGFFSLSYHFSSFAKGLLDFSDLYYYISFIFLMIVINTGLIRRER